MLPGAVPNSRIMEFYYPQQHASIQNLRNLSERFLRCYSERSGASEEPTRPVIFIAYGHGGLVLELAVMISYSRQRATSSLTSSTPVVEPPKGHGSPSTEANALSPSTKSSSSVVSMTPPNIIKDQAQSPHDQLQSSGSMKLAVVPEVAQITNSSRRKSSSQGDKKANKLSIVPHGGRWQKDSAHTKVDDSDNTKPNTKPNLTLNLGVVAGILLLGSPGKVPVPASLEEADISKLEDLADKNSKEELTLEKLLGACVETVVFTETRVKYPRRTIHHSCFERIVSIVGVNTYWYRGRDEFPLENGQYFKEVCWSILLSPLFIFRYRDQCGDWFAVKFNPRICVFAR